MIENRTILKQNIIIEINIEKDTQGKGAGDRERMICERRLTPFSISSNRSVRANYMNLRTIFRCHFDLLRNESRADTEGN